MQIKESTRLSFEDLQWQQGVNYSCIDWELNCERNKMFYFNFKKIVSGQHIPISF